MTSSPFTNLSARIEYWPITGSLAISRGTKTAAMTIGAEIRRGGFASRVPYPRYGETPEAALWG